MGVFTWFGLWLIAACVVWLFMASAGVLSQECDKAVERWMKERE